MRGRAAAVAVFAFALLVGGIACERAPETTGTDAPIAAAELAARIEAGSAPLILDVRTPEEFAAGHIPGAVNIPHDQLASRLAELEAEESAEIVVHCQAGGRARSAGAVLTDAGYLRVRDLDGHMAGWRRAGLPTE